MIQTEAARKAPKCVIKIPDDPAATPHEESAPELAQRILQFLSHFDGVYRDLDNGRIHPNEARPKIDRLREELKFARARLEECLGGGRSGADAA